MRTNKEMLTEIETAMNGDGPDPIRGYEGNALEAIKQAVHDREQLDSFIETMVAVAHQQGASWVMIDSVLGTSHQAAHERYAQLA